MLSTSIWRALVAAQPATSDNHGEHAAHGDRQQQVAQR